MIDVEGYQIIKKLHIGSRTIVFKSLRTKDNLPVILKVLKREYPSIEDITTIEHEYHILKKLKIPGVIETHGLIKHQNRLVLILDEGHGDTLENLIIQGPVELKKFFKIALSLISIVSELHKSHVIHKDIKPANIIINSDDDSVNLIDFSIASELFDRISPNSNINHLEGTLAYMAPEQTGRMDTSLDQRTDMYSMGVVFYELLTGQKPFIAEDPLELVYSHLARPPLALNILNPNIPIQVSNVVLKLLAKDPNERYFSAEGLIADLSECQDQWNMCKKINPFELGTHDEPMKLMINQKLYGRDEEIAKLLSLFQQVNNGEIDSACVLVSGYAGIGKSALVQVLKKHIINKNGFFTSGKFEQLQKNIPYSAIIKAFQRLIGQIMSQSKEAILPLKNNMLNNLGHLGQVVIDLIPELELLIGQQPPIPVLTPAETQNRFIMVFQKFLESITQQGRVLVFFLDDLQWADSASLKFLEYILIDKEIKNFLVICAYRNNEVDEHHAVTHFIKKIRQHHENVNQLELGALSLESVKQLLKDNLYSDLNEAAPLAKLLITKTAGNAFFIKKYLQTLNQEQQITYDRKLRKWSWDLNQITKTQIADNVVDLMIKKIEALESATKRTLSLAACIGNLFTLNTLASISNQPLNRLANHLKEAILAGLILPLDEAYKYVELLSESHLDRKEFIHSAPKEVEFQFLHDRVQQAAYTFIPDNQKQKTHLKIGRLLLEIFPHPEESEHLFIILNHLNKGLRFIEKNEELELVSKLNLAGGLKAKAATAHETAVSYFQAGINLLGESAWEKNYDLIFLLYKEASQCKYFSGHFTEAEQDFKLLLNQAHSDYDKATVLDMRAELYSNFGKFYEAVTTQISALKLLGVSFPKKVFTINILLEMIKIKTLINFKKISNLDRKSKYLEDPTKILITKIFNHLIFPAYSSDEKIFILGIFKSVTFFLLNGYSNFSLETLLNYAIILDAEFKNFSQGLAFTNLVKKLEKNCDSRQIYVRNAITIAVFINHWHYHIRKIFPDMQESIIICKEVGDLFYAAGTSAVYTIYLHESGLELEKLSTEIQSSLSFLKHEDSDFKEFSTIFSKIINYLKDKDGTLESIFESLEKMKQTENNSTYFVAHYYVGQLLYYMENYELALHYLDKAGLYKRAAIGTFPIISYEVFCVLTKAKLYSKMPRAQQRAYLKSMIKTFKYLMTLAKQCPENFSHMSYLVGAEIFRLKNKVNKAERFYDRAIEAALSNGYLQYVAIANDNAGEFYDQLKRNTVSRAYLQAAHYYYLRYECRGKISLMEERFPHLQSNSDLTKDLWATSSTQHMTSLSSTSDSISALDLFSILKANRSISNEVTLPNVLQKLIEIVIENSGAQRAMLINVRGNRYFIEAEGRLIDNVISVKFENNPAESRDDVPHVLLNYVANSQRQVIYQNISEVAEFSYDPYIVNSHLKSVLCIPIIQKTHVNSILYLENNLLPGAFTIDHARLINALSAQAVISLENAKLYAAYEKFVPYQFLHQLNKSSITDVRLGDQVELTMTILFCDIEGFSKMSENMWPAEVFDFINEFLSVMEPIIRQHRGFIDKYIGDAIMALFSEPYLALKTALQMIDKIEKLNETRTENNLPPIKVGIGIDTGKVMMGIIGSQERLETSVLSDAVNNASNIQQLTRSYNVPILLTAETKAALYHPENFPMKLVGKVKFKGKTQSIELWELLRNK